MTYVREEFGKEVEAPSGYYQPLEEVVIDFHGRQVLYTRGTGCIEASCCGVGSWQYVRVEGYVVGRGAAAPAGEHGGEEGAEEGLEIDTVENDADKQAIVKFLLEAYPGVRIEFR